MDAHFHLIWLWLHVFDYGGHAVYCLLSGCWAPPTGKVL